MSAAPETKYLLLWKGRQSGPFDFEAIREMLRCGEISRMHQVSVNGKWMVLDELLEQQGAGYRDALQRVETEKRSPLSRLLPPRPTPMAPPAPALEDGDQLPDEPPRPLSGLAFAAFVASLCNFVPYLNFVAWILALGFGHLALKQLNRNPILRGRWMALTGLAITYFLLVMALTFAILMVSNHHRLF